MFDKYVYVFVDALDPRIALPCKETRDGLAARARTLRAVVAPVLRDAFVVPVRETTLRDATPRDALFVVVAAVVARDEFAVVTREEFAALARDATLRDGVAAVVVPVARDTVFVALRGVALLRPVAPARPDCAVIAAGAIGSAKTARIDTNVEQTKNAPANKNTVPIAFLQKSAKLRLFIKYSPVSGVGRKTRCFTARMHAIGIYTLSNYNIFENLCK